MVSLFSSGERLEIQKLLMLTKHCSDVFPNSNIVFDFFQRYLFLVQHHIMNCTFFYYMVCSIITGALFFLTLFRVRNSLS